MEKKYYRVYSLKIATYLTNRGFTYVRQVPDLKKPNFNNWVFELTPELQAALDEYFAG